MEWLHACRQMVYPVICDVLKMLCQSVADEMTTVVDVVATYELYYAGVMLSVADGMATVNIRVFTLTYTLGC